jgi:hypothetical protein
MVVVEIFDEFQGLQSKLADVTMQCRLVVMGAKSQGTPISLDSPAIFTNYNQQLDHYLQKSITK